MLDRNVTHMQIWSYKRVVGGILLKIILRYKSAISFRCKILCIAPIELLKFSNLSIMWVLEIVECFEGNFLFCLSN